MKKKRLIRIVILNKYDVNTYCSIKKALDTVRRNIRAGYTGFITEPNKVK
jgi:hypothetical protein